MKRKKGREDNKKIDKINMIGGGKEEIEIELKSEGKEEKKSIVNWCRNNEKWREEKKKKREDKEIIGEEENIENDGDEENDDRNEIEDNEEK